jgi:FtsH-binding integral membrane protein
MWGAALLWFSVVILHPALSTYGQLTGKGAVWFVLLFSTLMVIALSTWGYFRLRDARLERTKESTT